MSIQAVSACRDVELPAVPGTGHYVLMQCSFGEWPTGVRTDSIHRMERPIRIKHGNNPPCDNKFTALADRNLVDTGHSMAIHFGYLTLKVAIQRA